MKTPRTTTAANALYLAALARARRPPLGQIGATRRRLREVTTACLRQAGKVVRT